MEFRRGQGMTDLQGCERNLELSENASFFSAARLKLSIGLKDPSQTKGDVLSGKNCEALAGVPVVHSS
jgi:hypothetical protein